MQFWLPYRLANRITELMSPVSVAMEERSCGEGGHKGGNFKIINV